MANPIGKIKKGDTFNYYIQWQGALLGELSSQIRTKTGAFLSDVTIKDTATPDTFQLTVEDTTNWIIGTVYTDIQRNFADGRIVSSETMSISVIKDVTL